MRLVDPKRLKYDASIANVMVKFATLVAAHEADSFEAFLSREEEKGEKSRKKKEKL